MCSTQLELPLCDEPDVAMVDKYHGLYLERLRGLYNEHRVEHEAYANKELEIW